MKGTAQQSAGPEAGRAVLRIKQVIGEAVVRPGYLDEGVASDIYSRKKAQARPGQPQALQAPYASDFQWRVSSLPMFAQDLSQPSEWSEDGPCLTFEC